MARITGALHEDRYTFMILSRSVLLRMRNVSEKKLYRESQNTHFMFNKLSFLKKKVPLMG